MELIHALVEALDRHFGSVCELDIMFALDTAHWALDEFVSGGGGRGREQGERAGGPGPAGEGAGRVRREREREGVWGQMRVEKGEGRALKKIFFFFPFTHGLSLTHAFPPPPPPLRPAAALSWALELDKLRAARAARRAPDARARYGQRGMPAARHTFLSVVTPTPSAAAAAWMGTSK